MKFEDAVKAANEYLLNEDGLPVSKAYDAQTHWIFYAVSEEGFSIGNAGVKVEKKTGNLADFILPDDENFELLDRANEIELPKNGEERNFFVVQ